MYDFKGHNWTELGKAWGLYRPEEEKFEGVEKETGLGFFEYYHYRRIQDKLKEEMYLPKPNQEPNQEMVKDLKVFITKLAEQADKINYCAPVWRGFLAIEDDQTLLSWVHDNLLRMWS